MYIYKNNFPLQTKHQTPNASVIGAAATAGAVRPGAGHGGNEGVPEATGAAKLQRFSGTTRAPLAAKQGGGTMALPETGRET